MSDRLPELLRQRALVQEHLAWLDREIATAQGHALSGAVPRSEVAVTRSNPPPLPASPAAVVHPGARDDTGTLLERYQQDSATLKADVRRGCLLYFVGALALLAAVIGVVYFFYVSRPGG